MKSIRCFEVGDEVYPKKDWPDWKRETQGKVVRYQWTIYRGEPRQVLQVRLINIDVCMLADDVEIVAVTADDLERFHTGRG